MAIADALSGLRRLDGVMGSQLGQVSSSRKCQPFAGIRVRALWKLTSTGVAATAYTFTPKLQGLLQYAVTGSLPICKNGPDRIHPIAVRLSD